MQNAVSRAMEVAKQTGDMPSYLGRAIGDLIEPKIKWSEQLKQFVVSSAGREELSMRRPNKRALVLPPTMILPGRDGFSLNCAVLSIDTSGSISEQEATAFLSEAKAIFEDLKPRELWIAWWDTEAVLFQVSDLDDIEQATPYGGGGTDYTCVPKAIDMHGLEPDVVICFTDGAVRWPDANAIALPHVTVSTTCLEAPFGANIRYEV